MNPRPGDLSDDDYQTLLQRGLSDRQIEAMSPSGLRLLTSPSTSAGPAAPVPAAPPVFDRIGRPDRLMQTQREFVSEALGVRSPEEVAERDTRVRALDSVPFTAGGAIAPGMGQATRAITSGAELAGEASPFTEAVRLSRGQQTSGGGLAELVSGFLPQTIETSSARRARVDREFQADRAAFEQMTSLVESGARPGLRLDDIVGSPEYAARRRAILSGELGPDLLQAARAVSVPQRRATLSGEARRLADTLGPGLRDVLTRPISTGELVESPTMYGLRVLSAPTSAAVGLGEGALSSATVPQSIGSRVRVGEGFVGGGRDLGSTAADLAGLGEDSALRSTLKTGGAGLGLVGELLTPIDLGVTALASTGARAVRAGTLASAAGASTREALGAAAGATRRASRRTVNSRLVDLIADSDPVSEDALRLARVLEVDDAPAPAPSPQQTMFGGPPPDPPAPAQSTMFGGPPPPDPPAVQSTMFGGPPPPDPPAAQSTMFGGPPPPDPPAPAPSLFDGRAVDPANPSPTVIDTRVTNPNAVVDNRVPSRPLDAARPVDDVAEVDSLTDALRRSGIDDDAPAFVARLETGGLISPRVARSVRAALDAGEDALEALKRATPAPGVVRRVVPSASDEAPSVEDVARVLALQAGGRMVRAADLAGPRVRLTPRLIAERDVANDIFKGFQSRPSAMLTQALSDNPGYILPATARAEVRVRLRDLVNDTEGVSVDDLAELGLSLREGASTVPLRVINRAVLDDFERVALSTGKVSEVAPAGGRLGGAAAPGVEGADLRSALRPVELRPGRIRAALEARLPADAFDDIDPALRPLVDELVERWGGIDEEFLQRMRAERGVPRPVAFARVLSSTYDSPRQMFGDVLANLYGGFETMGDMVFGASSHRVLMDLRSSPAKLRTEIAEVLRADVLPEQLAELAPLLDAFGASDDWAEAALSALLVIARRLGSEGVSLKQLGGTIETPPLFQPRDMVDLLSASYFQRREAAIVAEVFAPDKMRDVGLLAEFAPSEFVAGLRDTLNAAGYGRVLDDRDVVEMLGFALADEAVYRRANNPQQAWLFADIGPTVPYPIRRLLGDLTEDQQKELYSLVRDRAIEMTQAPAARGNYNEGLKRFIELYADNKVNTPVARLEALGLNKQQRRRLAGLASPESFQKMMQRVKADNSDNNRFLMRLGDTLSSGSSLSRWAKGGILAGRLLPNMVYMGVNYLTAPAIVYSTMGLRAGARAAGRMVGANMGALAPMRVSLGQTQLGPMVVARSPSGVVYTAGDVARLLPRISTQGGAELSEDVLRTLGAWSGLSARRAADPATTSIRGAGQSRARRVLREWTGFDVSDLRDGGASIQVNVFNQAANASDIYFRAGVLVDALTNGRTVDEAVRLANDALFDYGRVSQLERNTISKVVWFWSFRRESLRTTMINALEAPERFRASYQATGLFDDDESYTVATKDYMALRPFIDLIEDPEIQRRYGNYGPSIPLLEGVAELVDYMSAGYLLLDGLLYTAIDYDASPELMRPGGAGVARRGFEASTVLGKRLIQYGLSETAVPAATLLSEVGLGVQRRDGGAPVSGYLDPRLLAYLRLSPDHEATLFGLVDIERIPIQDEYLGGGTFQGRQWRIADNERSRRAFSALRHAMLFAGFERTLRDYAPAYYAALGAGDAGAAIQLRPGLVDSEALDTTFRMLGAVTPTNLPTVDERERGNLRSLEYVIREAQR